MEPARYLANALRFKCLAYGAMWICLVEMWGCVVEEMSASNKLVCWHLNFAAGCLNLV